MKMRNLCLVIAAALFCTSCSQTDAQRYAELLKKVIASYEREQARKVDAEEVSYRKFVAVYGQAADEAAYEGLEAERTDRVRHTALDLQRGTVPFEDWRDVLLQYATVDFNATRQVLQSGADANHRYMANVESLKVDEARIEALSALLDGLSKPESLRDRFTLLEDFGRNVSAAYDKKMCAGIKGQLDGLENTPENQKSRRAISDLLVLKGCREGSKPHE